MSDFLQSLAVLDLVLLLGAVFGFLSYHRAPLWLASLLVLGVAYGLEVSNTVMTAIIVVLAILNLTVIRRYVVTYPVFIALKVLNFLPVISKTEKEAIEAGSVWMDAELFSGKPNFKTILDQPYPELSSDERAFVDGPLETCCEMVDDWTVYQNRDFSEEIWTFLKKERFFGLIIPKEYGGLGFSALANSAIISKLSSRSTPLGITVMVPNSLGPAELLVHYGTEEQKEYYLPRLANGEEIPCFALTEPGAGSDAGAMTSTGVVFKGKDGALMIRLNWNKRYITLASKATLLGLAFKLKDPDNLLGKGEDVGITCALIPVDTKGVVVGDRHDPLGVPFHNSPTQGHDVEIPLTAVIGGDSGVGCGWKMLMESLAAGRGISLPANCSGGSKLVTRAVGAYSALRKQFGVEIGKFEGVHEPLSEIGGMTYLMEAGRRYTCGGLDQGAKPAVVTAILKYHFTEMFRTVINHGMDIAGGAGISTGPRNLLAHPYIATPISITVEGANILTRALIIFGQGSIRCHPYVLDEVHGIEENNLARFDKAFWGHQGHIISNLVRSIFLTATRGLFVFPARFGTTARYYQKLTWASAKFAIYADLALVLFGGALKRKERITARFGDVLSWMYLAAAVLKRFDAEGAPKEDRPFLDWSMQYAFASIQEAFEELFKNMGPLFFLSRWITRINPLGTAPKDSVSSRVAELIQKPGAQRDRMTEGMYLSDDEKEGLGRLDHAFAVVSSLKNEYKKVQIAVRKKTISKGSMTGMIHEAVEKSVLTKEEAQKLLEAEQLREDVIQVDYFTKEQYFSKAVK